MGTVIIIAVNNNYYVKVLHSDILKLKVQHTLLPSSPVVEMTTSYLSVEFRLNSIVLVSLTITYIYT